jgi:hypothetical protein
MSRSTPAVPCLFLKLPVDGKLMARDKWLRPWRRPRVPVSDVCLPGYHYLADLVCVPCVELVGVLDRYLTCRAGPALLSTWTSGFGTQIKLDERGRRPGLFPKNQGKV